jgi:hypothetical protein
MIAKKACFAVDIPFTREGILTESSDLIEIKRIKVMKVDVQNIPHYVYYPNYQYVIHISATRKVKFVLCRVIQLSGRKFSDIYGLLFG